MINERALDIMKKCVSIDSFITTDELAKSLSVSSRTIKSDINFIEENSSEFGIDVEVIRGVGTRIKIDNIIKFNETVNQSINSMDFNIRNNRLVYLIRRFIQSKTFLSEYDLMNELFISRSVLLEDIENVKVLLSEESVELKRKRNEGWIINGDEDKLRKLLSKYIELDLNFLDSYNLFLRSDKLSYEEVNTLKMYIIDILENHNKEIYGVNITNLMVHIIVLTERIKMGNTLTSFVMDDQEILKDDINLVNELVLTVESFYDLSLSNLEVKYLYYCMVGKFDEVEQNNISDVDCFLESTLSKITSIFGIKFTDKSFMEAIRAHTISLLNRVEFNYNVNNEFDIYTQEMVLPSECALLYKRKFEINYGHILNEIETYYITVHFGAFLEKIKRQNFRKSILLVSDERLSVSLYIKNKLNTELNNIAEIEEIIQTHEIREIDKSKYDYIISTENISDMCDDYLLIEKTATMLTIRQVKEYVKDYKTLYEIFRKDLFQQNVIFSSKEDLLKSSCELFYAKGYIKNENKFYEEVLKRESYQSTRLNNNLSIPHPLTPITDESFISIIIPDSPIKWTCGLDAKLIFIISISKNGKNSDVNIIFDTLSLIAADDLLVNRLTESSDYDEFMKIIISEGRK